MEILALLGFLFFVVPIAGVIWFVTSRNKKRIAAQTPIWRALAEHYRGTFRPAVGAFGGNSVVIPGATGSILVETQVVSTMQALGSPYFRMGSRASGGTFTLVRAGHPVLRKQVETGAVVLPYGGHVVRQAHELAVVFAGAVNDQAALSAAVDYVIAAVEQIKAAA